MGTNFKRPTLKKGAKRGSSQIEENEKRQKRKTGREVNHKKTERPNEKMKVNEKIKVKKINSKKAIKN